MAGFATISIRFNTDLRQFSSGIQNAQRKMKALGSQMQATGRNLTIGLTAPIVALGFKSVKAFDIQAKAIAQVEAGVRSTGKAAGFATEELLKMASDLQNKTIFGDEEILKGATAQLLTFTNIAGEQFARTQLAALNLATRLDGDLKSASIQLGKALNDPVANLSALSRSGIQFSTDQKAVIKQLANTNRLAEAQTIILDELENQYGGAAEAAAKAGLGGFTQFSNILGDVAEDFGEIILEYLNPFLEKLKALATRFKELDPSIKKTIVVVAGLAAAIGPVLVVMGFLIANIIPALAAGFTALTGPIGLVIAAIAGIAVVVYKNWDRIKAEMVELRNYFTDLYNESVVFRIGVEQVILVFRTLYDVVKLVLNATLSGFKNSFEFILGSLKNVGKAFRAVLTGDIAAIPKIFSEQVKLGFVSLSKSVIDLSGDIDDFTTDMKKNIGNALDGITQRKKLVFNATVKVDEIQKTTPGTTPETPVGGEGGRSLVESLSTLKELAKPILTSPLDIIAPKIQQQIGQMNDAQVRGIQNAIAFKEGLSQIMTDAAAGFAVGFAEMIGNAAEGGLSLGNISQLILGTLADMAIQVGKMAIGIGLAVEGIKKALQSLAGPVAIAAGIALIALGTFAKSALSDIGGSGGNVQQPRIALANGGIAYGPTNALIGEYSGARSNPEVVAPLDKLKNMIADVSGGGNVRVTGEFKIRNRELVAQVDSGRKSISRRS